MTGGDGVSISARQPTAIHSALSMLEAVAAMGAGVTARQLAEHLGMPRATTYRLLNLLVQDEYLVRTPDLTGFALGTKVALLAGSIAVERVPRAARDVLERTRRARGVASTSSSTATAESSSPMRTPTFPSRTGWGCSTSPPDTRWVCCHSSCEEKSSAGSTSPTTSSPSSASRA